MISALSGFALIGAIVLTGWGVGRWGALPENAETVLGRLVYSVLTPCLLFTVVAAADLRVLLSEPLLVSAAAALLCFAAFAATARRLDRGAKVVGALAAGYTNANYIGIPVATYVLDDAALVVPIVMWQLLVVTPVALALLEIAATGRTSVRATVTAPLRNPLIVAVVLGLLVGVTGLRMPALLAAPVATIGSAAVPVVLIAFGMSLSGRRVLEPGTDRVATIVAVVLKTVVMPAFAFVLAIALGLPDDATYAVVVLAALPTAQNIFLYAQRFQTGLVLARDAIFLSTLASVPVLLLAAILFTR
ncbi:AEC family transporter [Couchioplanes caeruleus]|uniref:Transporter n=1 Tax=Couchioplanes caeruleus subsp. caeruleus TaxID=56427 RepID=A0A1K0FMN6_9ACTN|nr:AEC family transporter [Couchioplanes caeruleus]OJF14103.1 transporter [Couchioplanes caeruleus subsp. caeruleus]